MEKLKELIKILIYPLFIYLQIRVEIIMILSVLMVIDSCLGGIKAVRLGQKFEMKVLLWGFILKQILLIIPFTIALIGKGIDYNIVMLVHVTIKIMIVSEGYSILGNIYAIKNKVNVNKLDAISMMIKSLRKILYVGIQNGIKKAEDSASCGLNDNKKD